MKKYLFIAVISAIFIQSCVYESPRPRGLDGRDGLSFFKINWVDKDPFFVDPGGVIPGNFYWDTYYRTNPGLYTVYYEYKYSTYMGTVIYPYEVDIEVFYYAGEAGSYNRDGRDGDDVYFELVLYPNGYFDYVHVIDYKHDVVQDSVKVQDSIGRVKIGENQVVKDGVGVTYTYYKLPQYAIEE